MKLSGMKNLGAVTAERLDAVGIHTPEDLEAVGAVRAYRKVQARFPRETTLVLLYALEGALRDAHWTALTPAEKERLRREAEGDDHA